MPLKAMSTWTDVLGYFCEKELYLSWLIFYKCSLSIHATNISSPNNVSALMIFPQALKTYMKS